METRNSPYVNIEDRISRLPDSLIHHILSSLNTKFAVQTCVLSKRWRYIWTSMPTLNLSSHTFRDLNTGRCDRFIDFVDQVFLLRDVSDILKIGFDVQKGCNLQSRLNTWIIAALNHNVKEIAIIFWLDQFQFPHRLFSCNLKSLVLVKRGVGCIPMVVPGTIDLPHLKSLRIEGYSFDNEELTNEFFSRCPLLESLVLHHCKFTHLNIKISNRNLERIEIMKTTEASENGLHLDNGTVTLCTPNLLSFRTNDYMSTGYSLPNLSSIVTADIQSFSVVKNMYAPLDLELPAGIKELFAKRIFQFLGAVHNVKDLRLSHLSLEFASSALEKLDSQHPQFCNLKCLNLRTSLSIDSSNAITCLLKNTPNVESVEIEVTQHFLACASARLFLKPAMCPYVDEVNLADVESYWKTKLSLPSMLYYLKSVKVLGIEGRINELMLFELLLKNSVALEQVVVENCPFKKCREPNADLRNRRMKKFCDKLQKLPRAAANVSILFNN